MTLRPPVLDDLGWEQMVAAILRRVPAESDGRWTLHAPVDPGVTLLELFAYLLEQRLYWLDQVPDELVLAVLRHLGLPGPRPATPAGTVLRLRAEPTATVVPKGTVFARDPEQQVAFTVETDTVVLPVADTGTRLWAGGQERTADLAAQRAVPLLPATGGPAEARIVLELSPPAGAVVPPPAGAVASLLLHLRAPGTCPAGWLPTAVPDVPPAADLTWTWYRPDPEDPSRGDELPPIDPATVDDGTGGLRRSGLVRLPLPQQWCDGAPDPAPTFYGLRLRTDASTFSVAPALLQLVPNVTVASHRRTLRVTTPDVADQLRAWLRLPNQHLDLPGARGQLLDAVVRLVRDGTRSTWSPVADRTFSGPGSRVFVLDREAGAVRFGDGLTGAVPVLDATPPDGDPDPVLEVTYSLGGGTAGNGGLTKNWTLVRDDASNGHPVPTPAPDLQATAENVVPAEGGREPENIPAVRARIGDSVAEVTRAVSVDDIVTLVTATPGVAVARCYVGIGEHPRYPCSAVPGAVTVRVVPGVTDPSARISDPAYDPALRPDPGALRAVAARLDPARLIGTELFVRPPVYRPVSVQVVLSGAPSDRAAVRALLGDGLRRYLDALVGGDDRSGWPFGEPVRPSALLRATQSVLGDLAEVERVAIGLDGAAPSDGCDDVPIGVGRLPALGEIRIASLAGTPGEGLL